MLERMKEIIAEQLSVEEEIVTESSSFKEDFKCTRKENCGMACM